jgi:hypothetical protein
MKPYISAVYGLKAVSPPTGRFIHHRVAWLAQRPRLVADGTLSKMRCCFYPWERRTTERCKTILGWQSAGVLLLILAQASRTGSAEGSRTPG